MAKLRQFLLLIWKNFKLQIRHPWQTLFELGIPTFFSILLIVVRINVDSQYVSHPTIFDSFAVNEFGNSVPAFAWKILFAPSNSPFKEIVNRTCERLHVEMPPAGFKNEDELIKYYLNEAYEGEIYAGVVFDVTDNSSALPSNIKYKLRLKALSGQATLTTVGDWKTKYAFPAMQTLGPREKTDLYGGIPGYMKRGFLPLQHALDMSIIESLEKNSSDLDIFTLRMQRYPYPPYDDDNFLMNLQFFFPFVIMLSFVYPCLNIVKNLVAEKEKKLKEAMKMMGLSNWMHWTAWYIKYFLFLCISVGVITILLTVKFQDERSVIIQSDPSVVFFILLAYSASTICFCFFLSVLFSKANSAAAGAGIIFFLTLVPYLFIFPRYYDLSLSEKMGSCMLLNTALALATIVLTTWESTGIGLQWDGLSKLPTPDDNLSMNMVLLMMFIDALLYLFLTWYIEAVFPGEFGVPEPWYFPLTKSYWCGTQQDFQNLTRLYDCDDKQWEFFENEPSNLMPGIQIQGLTKVYSSSKTPSVNNLNINMFRGQITVLLGHNGAGKTTTISMLTGLFPPTSGIGVVNGYDICDDIEGVHSSLGICPQHNVLFDDLTVEEHLLFFCRLKGYISDLVPVEVSRMLSALGLEDKRREIAKNLSGGMKRKLSVGIALVGGSKVVMLDEPTSGMDPSARRFTWDLLQAEKEDRTLLLTTHFMEEADILGDRIAIMASGEIQCCGSPLFLKKKYGAGYHLVMVKDHSCNVNTITCLIRFYIPNAEMLRNIGTELTYILPHESSHLFQNLFAEIESRQEELKISSFGASITTMEEVFIKVGERASMNELLTKCSEKANLHNAPTSSSLSDSGAYDLGDGPSSSASEMTVSMQGIFHEVPKNSGVILFFQQLKTLILKRIIYSSRNWLLTLSQLILPPFFLVLTLIILKTMPKPEDSPPLNMDLNPFRQTIVPYATDVNQVTQRMAGIFKSQFNGTHNDVRLVEDRNMTLFLITDGIKDIGQYNLQNIIAATFGVDEKIQLMSWFNDQAFHSPAIALSCMDNMLLKFFVNSTYSLSTVNYPFPRTVGEQAQQQQFQPTEAYEIAQDIMFGMSFLIASFSVFLVKEKSTRSKHLQRVSGVNLFSFWMATFVWDFVCYLISCLLVLLTFYCFGTKGMSSAEEQGRLLLLFVVHGCSALPFIYCLSFLFQLPSTAYVCLCLCNIIGGIGTVLTVTIMEIPQLHVTNIGNTLDWLFTIILPNYALGRSVSNLYQNYQFTSICSKLAQTCSWTPPLFTACCPDKCKDNCIPWTPNPLSWNSPGIGKQVVFLSIQTICYFLVLCALELKACRYLTYYLKRPRSATISKNGDEDEIVAVEDDDISAEHSRIMNTPLSNLCLNNRLVLSSVTKHYRSLVAVDKISFGVHKGECFGLLGLNGAGKTTTFKMITGEKSITFGDVYLDGFSVKSSMRKVQQRLGYCPQFDALIDQLTGRETLIMYARLRGLPENMISHQVTRLSSLLSFNMHIDKQVKEYSGGNKRKLSVAIALIGDPPMIFLDEPTTGMDPVSRHNIWDALLQVLHSGRSIVLTSHSMEECEALCNKLVIMVNGKLCCLGSPQHLKSKFGKGFTLLVKVETSLQHQSHHHINLQPEVSFLPASSQYPVACRHTEGVVLKKNIINVKEFIEETFPGSVLKDVHEGYLHYHIPKSGLSWSQIFGTIEKAKATLNIKDYSIGQTTLEQVFLNFARSQREQNE